jgi:hypothetical protein
MRNAYKISVGKPEGERPLRRPSHRLEDNIRMDLRGVGWRRVYGVHGAQDRDQCGALMNTVIKSGIS